MYKEYDQVELDAQYNMRNRHPEFETYFDHNEASSEQVRRNLACKLDVPYGAKAGERLDVFPASQPGSPVQFFIHGGYWQALDKQSHSFVAAPFVAAGCAVVVQRIICVYLCNLRTKKETLCLRLS